MLTTPQPIVSFVFFEAAAALVATLVDMPKGEALAMGEVPLAFAFAAALLNAWPALLT